jgi:ketol-acid reductoisomerase
MKLIVQLIYVRGIAGMNTAISNTTEYGEYVAGSRIVTDETSAEMKRILADIQSDRFARDWVVENMVGQSSFRPMRARRRTPHRRGRQTPPHHDAVVVAGARGSARKYY